jgi:hypothetical protein
MRLRILALLAATAPAWAAGMIRGIVLENLSGRPLSRSTVRLEMLKGSTIAAAASAYTDRSGQFFFSSLADGAYLLTAERPSYAPGRYGARKKLGSGAVIVMAGDFNLFAEIRLLKLGAVTGRIVDENQVGLPGQNVVVYNNAQPPQQIAKGVSDDRGIYRIAGLMPGRYWVRTASRLLDDGMGLLPTFFPQSVPKNEAKLVEVDLDADTQDIGIEPVVGKVVQLTADIGGPPGQAQLILASDTGRQYQSITVPGKAVFEGLAPGYYELIGEEPQTPPPLGPQGLHAEFFLDHDRRSIFEMQAQAEVRFLTDGRDGVTARRIDLAGEGPEIRIPQRDIRMGPGYWHVSVQNNPDYYFASVTAFPRSRGPRRDTSDTEVFIGPRGSVRVQVALSARPARLRGSVKSGGKPSPGAPAFLYPLDPAIRKRLNGMQIVRADAQGIYRFQGLAPGDYLALATFDWSEPTEEQLLAARAKTVTLREGEESAQDLDLHVEP